jgi:uncharacterized membrane protein
MSRNIMIKILKILKILVLGLALVIVITGAVSAQEIVMDKDELVPARVVEIMSERMETLPTSEAEFLVQNMRVKILKGSHQGKEIVVDNDYTKMKEGGRFILRITNTSDGRTLYGVSDFERRPALLGFFVLFMILVIALGKMQGVRSLVSLGISILTIFFVLIPLLLKGYSPVLVSTLVSAVILFFAIFFTHGFNRKSLIAFSGTVVAVVITGLLASLATAMTHMTGFSSHESVYLNFNTGGGLDFVGLYLASIMIGMLGVLDDISITQVAVVRELYGVASHLSKKEIFASAIRVGKEHVGALVNTLVLAYVGVALPSVLYFATSEVSIGHLINMELFASEIIRTILGSIGLILTVPVTTILAVIFMRDFKGKKLTLAEIEHESSHGHSHGGHRH